MNVIKSIDPGSVAEELEIEPGDILLTINGEKVVDIIDYMFLVNDEYLEIEIQKSDGEIWELEIDKTLDENLGINFENPIIDHAKSCTNKCVFCFIDQLPKGMRPSLYFKDDDSRLSFLQGNFVTLTNLKDQDIDRIIRYRISPINVSVHTTDTELRKKMLNNRFAGNIMERLKQLIDGGITVNAQIVLCPGYNDGEALSRTLTDLMAFHPNLNSVAIVPIGLTKHRDGLIEMVPFNAATSLETIERVSQFQSRAFEALGTRFAFLADEFYILAGVEFPADEAYEAYIQLEDGIGMIRKLVTEIEVAIKAKVTKKIKSQPRRSLIVTGVAAAPYLMQMGKKIESALPQVRMDVLKVENRFFGPRITVSGLLTGKDIISAVQQYEALDEIHQILLPDAMFRSGEEVLLDDMTREMLENMLGKPVYKVACEGDALLTVLMNGGHHV
jgi:putative radical SAM enzyme (TIGR03279 family)